MTDEERQELIEQMRRHDPWPCWPRVFEKAAAELEQLAKEVEYWKKRCEIAQSASINEPLTPTISPEWQ